MASQASNLGVNSINAQSISLVGDTIKAMLMKSAYSHNPDTDYVSSITANEASGGSYARQTLGTKSWNEDDTNNRSYFDAADITFSAVPAANGNVTGVVIFKDTGADATSTIIGWLEFSSPVTTNGGDIAVQFDSTGLLRYQV